MNREQLFELWAPVASPWSRWAKPVLFAELDASFAPTATEPVPRIDIQRDEQTAIVVDLPGANSVKTGLALAADGYRPVPLFNGSRGQPRHPGAVCLVNVEPIIEWLLRGVEELRRLALPAGASPAFLLDANRHAPNSILLPGHFDNRWVIFPQDFPSANFLGSQGIRRVLLLQSAGTDQPASDLAHVLRRWQEAGLELFSYSPAAGGAAQPIVIHKPPWFRALWQQLLVTAGRRRNSAGGFGSIIPQPSRSTG